MFAYAFKSVLFRYCATAIDEAVTCLVFFLLLSGSRWQRVGVQVFSNGLALFVMRYKQLNETGCADQ